MCITKNGTLRRILLSAHARPRTVALLRLKPENWWMRWLLPFLGLLVSGCSDNFQRAKGAQEYPATKDAYRVQHADPECILLGTTEAAGGSALDRIAEVAASHGGTHYVVTSDQLHDEWHTSGNATHIGGGNFVGSSTTRKATIRDNMRATVYRCP